MFAESYQIISWYSKSFCGLTQIETSSLNHWIGIVHRFVYRIILVIFQKKSILVKYPFLGAISRGLGLFWALLFDRAEAEPILFEYQRQTKNSNNLRYFTLITMAGMSIFCLKIKSNFFLANNQNLIYIFLYLVLCT